MKSILSEKHFMEHNEFKPSLRISRVNFTYEDKSEFCLSDISIEIYPGQFVAIVGESGSGKSTLADLALGMLRPNSGEILISNHPPLQAIRKWPGRIGYVPQDITIIEGDIRRNIILEAGENVSDRDIFRVLEKVYLLDDVRKMPNGIRELVGERGMKLSGGQRQRLGIARALFTDPKIIVFDEATSSLDPITENAVTEAIYSKKGDITLIVIAHRLSTVMNADLVVLLEKGKVIGQGTFEEVRRISPKFDQQAKLVNL